MDDSTHRWPVIGITAGLAVMLGVVRNFGNIVIGDGVVSAQTVILYGYVQQGAVFLLSPVLAVVVGYWFARRFDLSWLNRSSLTRVAGAIYGPLFVVQILIAVIFLPSSAFATATGYAVLSTVSGGTVLLVSLFAGSALARFNLDEDTPFQLTGTDMNAPSPPEPTTSSRHTEEETRPTR